MYNLFLRCFGIAGNIKTNIMATSKISQWINDYLYIQNIDSEEFVEVRNFMMLWNLFEARLFDCDFGGNKSNIDNIHLSSDIISVTLQYLQKRYTTKGATNSLFTGLHLRSNDNPTLVQKVLLGETDNSCDIVKAIVLIIYRYRNNLYHGNKEIASLPMQKDNFIYANRFLIACLEAKRE